MENDQKKRWMCGMYITRKYLRLHKINTRNLNVKIRVKARLNKYNATGIDVIHYKKYKEENKGRKPVYIYFVDEALGKIYGNYLSFLEQPYRDSNNMLFPNYSIARGIVLFSYEKMIMLANMNEIEIKRLRHFSPRNYEYKIQETHTRNTKNIKNKPPEAPDNKQGMFF